MRRVNEKEVSFTISCTRIDLDDLDLIISDLVRADFSVEIEAAGFVFDSVEEFELSKFAPKAIKVKAYNEEIGLCYLYIARHICSFSGPAGPWSHAIKDLIHSKRRPASVLEGRWLMFQAAIFSGALWLIYWSNVKAEGEFHPFFDSWIALGPFVVCILFLVSFSIDGGFRKIRSSKGGLLARNKDDLLKSLLLLAAGSIGTKLLEWLWASIQL